MTQIKYRVVMGVTSVLLLAMIATPLTVDQRGSVGVNQALAKSGPRGGHSDEGYWLSVRNLGRR
jgi:hypothetical protein